MLAAMTAAEVGDDVWGDDPTVLRLQARVLQTSLSHYGRQRVGCEILQIADEDRRRISALTSERPHTGTAEQRLRRTA